MCLKTGNEEIQFQTRTIEGVADRHGKKLFVLPEKRIEQPNADFLKWHNEHVYLGQEVGIDRDVSSLEKCEVLYMRYTPNVMIKQMEIVNLHIRVLKYYLLLKGY